ncbi:MAG: M48 family metalloprotease [Chitinispirillaceae bacterium]|nr:M48 family metalloprotease [Chitinispirillaceae bacterium]
MHKLKFIIPCTVSLIFSWLLSCSKISDTLTALFISDEQEVELGIQYKQQIEADVKNYPLYTKKSNYSSDLVNYINRIGQKLVQNQKDRTTIDFTFTIIDNDSVINAFAIPGGFVYVYTGLLLKTSSEDEIAGVIAHEIAHITHRHGAKKLKDQYGIDMLLDVLIGDSNAVRSVLDISSGLVFLKYSRDNEFEADSSAIEYLSTAGYNPSGMKTFLDVLVSMGSGSSKLATLLSTHPASEERVKKAVGIIDKKSLDIKNRPLTSKKYNP